MKKFKDAFRGLYDGFHHPSITIQWLLAACAMVAGIVLHLEIMEWVAVIICMGMVLAAEILNTCIEKLCDVYTREKREEIRIIKDLAASGVLAASLASFVAAILILIRHIQGG